MENTTNELDGRVQISPEGRNTGAVTRIGGRTITDVVSEIEKAPAHFAEELFHVEDVESSPFATIDGIVEYIHHRPFLGLGSFETDEYAFAAEKLQAEGMLSLSHSTYIDDFQQEKEQIYLAFSATDAEGKLRDPVSVGMRLTDFVLPLLNGTYPFEKPLSDESVTFVALESDQFTEIVGYAKNKEERRRYINEIDDDTNGRETSHALLIRAIKSRATDIHVEPKDENITRVRYRIDGVLHTQTDLSARRHASVVSAYKIDAKLNIAEKRRPQDGGIKYVATLPAFEETNEDSEESKDSIVANFNVTSTRKRLLHGRSFRMSTMPVEYGEKVVMRVLNEKDQIELRKLGFSDTVYGTLSEKMSSPNGLVLVTGPTGSGKTTTLYSALQLRNTDDINIVTIEDPVEVSLDGINQSNVNRSIDWTFKTALRTYLRQDPDMILVGEMRDRETAQTAMEAAKTGHLVLSTLHTNDAIGTLLRLKEMGIDNSDIYTCLQTVLAQRLVRKLNPEYTVGEHISPRLSQLMGENLTVDVKANRPADNLGVTESYGYFGRIPIAEIWTIGDEEKGLIFEGCQDHKKYTNLALDKGMEPIVVDGMKKVITGYTSLSELERVVPLDDFRRYASQIRNLINQ